MGHFALLFQRRSRPAERLPHTGGEQRTQHSKTFVLRQPHEVGICRNRLPKQLAVPAFSYEAKVSGACSAARTSSQCVMQ